MKMPWERETPKYKLKGNDLCVDGIFTIYRQVGCHPASKSPISTDLCIIDENKVRWNCYLTGAKLGEYSDAEGNKAEMYKCTYAPY